MYSCGINADETKEVGQNTQTVLKEIGIRIAGRMRCKLSKELLGSEYYYFAMDNVIREKLMIEYGISSDRVSVLHTKIIDPKDCPMEIYRECRNTIEGAIGDIELDKILLQSPMHPRDYWDSVSDIKQFNFLINSDERNIARYQKYVKQYGTYGVFELTEGAILRHHSEDYIHELTAPFLQKQFEHLTFTTMNGHVSNGFFYIGIK